jgi:Mg-chelatase subunit ChlD
VLVTIVAIASVVVAVTHRKQQASRAAELARMQEHSAREREALKLPDPSQDEAAANQPRLTALDNKLRGQLFKVDTDEHGTIAAVLVDTSGSMKDRVRDADGTERPKIEIARRCVVQLFTQAEQFAAAHPDQHIQLALYEFSVRDNQPRCRNVLRAAAPSAEAARKAVAKLRPEGDTPIGDALVFARGELALSGLAHQHLLVVTDGRNTKGLEPAEVVAAMSRLPEEQRPSTYLIAFDTDADKFAPLADAGALVLSAAGGTELQSTLDYVLSGKILAEQPLAPSELKNDGELR